MSDLSGKQNRGFNVSEFWLKILLLILFCAALLPQNAYAQQSNDESGQEEISAKATIDSILNLIKPTMPDSLKALLYNQVATSSPSISDRLKYANMSLQYCNKTIVDSMMLQNRLVIGSC